LRGTTPSLVKPTGIRSQFVGASTTIRVIKPGTILCVYESVPKWAANLFWKIWYPVLTGFARRGEVVFLNYGYAEINGAALSPARKSRLCIEVS